MASVKTIIRNSVDLDAAHRTVLEHVVGERLNDNQQLVIGIVDLERKQETPAERTTPAAADIATLPDWCDVYAGLSDEEIAELEQAILRRADLTRPS